jgi:hypothetical protein
MLVCNREARELQLILIIAHASGRPVHIISHEMRIINFMTLIDAYLS